MPDGPPPAAGALVANARMYSVSPAAEARWQELFEAVGREAGVALRYEAYPAPQPLEQLWSRPGLGLVFICGWPFAKTFIEGSRTGMQPVAAPVPLRFGAPLYASDFVVRADSPAETLADTFGGRIGWTVEHSQSGFNGPRHHLLRLREAGLLPPFGKSIGHLVTARRIVDAVLAGGIDVGPLDAYWHELLKRHEPGLAAGLRTVGTTEPVPAPLLVASPDVDPAVVERLAAVLEAVTADGRHGPILRELQLAGFARVAREDYEPLLAQERAAIEAGYLTPG